MFLKHNVFYHNILYDSEISHFKTNFKYIISKTFNETYLLLDIGII